jgi:hypothetical protein
MSKTKSVYIAIQEDLVDGYFSLLRIAEINGVSLEYVQQIEQEMQDQLKSEEMDYYAGETDDAYALASAGYGMDEDYGSFDDYNYDYV